VSVASLRVFYYAGTNITIAGNATSGGSSINTLVSLELMTPHGNSIIKTVASGTDPLEGSWPINITSFYPSDNQGNQVSGFSNGSQGYFTVQIQSMADIDMNYLFFLDVLDIYDTSIGQTWNRGIILAGGSASFISGINIPPGICNGSATAYVDILSDWPHDDGVPYCPEQNVAFTITGGPTNKVKRLNYGPLNFTSCYTSVFNFSSDYSYGTYSVYATMEYKTFITASNTTFFNTVLCDFTGDGRVDVYDLGKLLHAMGSTPGSPKWFIDIDVTQDGRVDVYDAGIVIRAVKTHV